MNILTWIKLHNIAKTILSKFRTKVGKNKITVDWDQKTYQCDRIQITTPVFFKPVCVLHFPKCFEQDGREGVAFLKMLH